MLYRSSFFPSLLGSPRLFHDFLHTLIVLTAVLLEQARRFRVCRGVWVGVTQQALNGREHSRDVVYRTPVTLQNVQADTAIVVHVGVEQARHKLDDWRFIWIVLCKIESQFKGASLPWCVVRSFFIFICLNDFPP